MYNYTLMESIYVKHSHNFYTKYLYQVKNTTKSLMVKGYLIALKQKSHATWVSNYYIIISYVKNALAVVVATTITFAKLI